MVAARPQGGIRPPRVPVLSCSGDFRRRGPRAGILPCLTHSWEPAASGPGLPELLFPSLRVSPYSLWPHNWSGNFSRDWVSTCPSRICCLELIQEGMMPSGLLVLVSRRPGEPCVKFRWCWCSLSPPQKWQNEPRALTALPGCGKPRFQPTDGAGDSQNDKFPQAA